MAHVEPKMLAALAFTTSALAVLATAQATTELAVRIAQHESAPLGAGRPMLQAHGVAIIAGLIAALVWAAVVALKAPSLLASADASWRLPAVVAAGVGLVAGGSQGLVLWQGLAGYEAMAGSPIAGLCAAAFGIGAVLGAVSGVAAQAAVRSEKVGPSIGLAGAGLGLLAILALLLFA